jgi:predicted acyltransferase
MNNQRIVSIDFLRGLTIALMIVVNNPGSWGMWDSENSKWINHLFLPFSHAHWNGCTSTDLIFPFFIFIVGASIAFAMGTKKLDSSNHGGLIKKVVIRGVLIIVLGILKDAFPFFHLTDAEYEMWGPLQWRIPGVLQRIGLVFILGGILFIKSSTRTLWVSLISILLGYWALINVSIEGVFIADLNKPNLNIGAYWDEIILTKNHLWPVSRAEGWDPESLLGTIPAVGTAIMGMLSGLFIKSERSVLDKVSGLFVVGGVATVVALGWNIVFPINKYLWTSSYVLYTGGIAAMLTAFCIWVMDYKGYTKISKPFIVYGSNALTAYILSELVSSFVHHVAIDGKSISGHIADFILSWFTSTPFTEISVNHTDMIYAKWASHIYAFLWMIPFYILLSWMYKKKIFIKV